MALLVISTCWDLSERDGTSSYIVFNLTILQKVFPEIYLLAPSGNSNLVFSNPKNYFQKTFFYRGFFRKYSLGYFTDINPSFRKSLGSIIAKHKISTIFIPFEWGVSFIRKAYPKMQIIYQSIGYERYFVQIVDKTLTYPIRAIKSHLTGLVEQAAIEKSSMIISVGDLLKKELLANFNIPAEKIVTIKYGIDTSNLSQSVKKEKKKLLEKYHLDPSKKYFVFHGGLNHQPNFEASQLIKTQIGPKIWELDKEIRFCIIGKGNRRNTRDNIESFPFIENLDEFIGGMTGAIMPILSGSGIRIKTLDYARNRIPIISTRKGIEGYGFTSREMIITPNKIDENFINAIIFIANSPAKADSLAEKCLEKIKSELNPEIMLKRLREASIINRICLPKPGPIPQRRFQVTQLPANVHYPNLVKLQFILSAIKKRYPNGGSAFEIGCGCGDVSIPIAMQGYQMVGIEIEASRVKQYKKVLSELALTQTMKVYRGDAEKLVDSVGGSARFDIIIASEVIEHVPHPERVFLGIKRLLKEDGLLILTIPNGLGPYSLMIDVFRNKFLYPLLKLVGKSEHLHQFSMSRLVNLLQSFEFKIEKAQNGSFLGFIFKRIPVIGARLEQYDPQFAAKIPTWMASGWYFLIRNKTK